MDPTALIKMIVMPFMSSYLLRVGRCGPFPLFALGARHGTSMWLGEVFLELFKCIGYFQRILDIFG